MTDYGYKMTDCGANGKTFERDLKAAFNRKAVVSKQGEVDFRKSYKNYEVKTAAGELGNYGEKLVKGVSLVLYVPVVNPALPVTEQEGFILDRVTFLECLESCGLIREKVSTSGQHKVTIQTFWNNKLNKPHGAKYFKLLDALYDNCLMTLEEWFDGE